MPAKPQINGRIRDLAFSNLAVGSMLRDRDVVALKAITSP
jgi:hypothetical protein